MTADGQILDQPLWATFDNVNTVAPKIYCSGRDLEWSPDGQHYVYWYHIDGTKMNELYLGDIYSMKVIKLLTFEEDFDNRIFSPTMHWLGDKRLFFFDKQSKELKTIDISTPKVTSWGSFSLFWERYIPAISPSPDGKLLVIQSWTSSEQSDFYLLNAESGTKVNISEEFHSDHGILFNSYFTPVWSDDSSKFVIAGEKDDRVVFILLKRDGEKLWILEAGDGEGFGLWVKWTLDGERLLIMCNPVSQGHYGTYNLCLVNTQGEVEQIFPYQRHWDPQKWSQWSHDGHFLYYLLKSGFAVYPAKLYRLDIRDGRYEMVSDGLRDYSWISSNEFRESDFRGIEWSSDGRWMILNNSGPIENLYAGRYGAHTTALICDPSNHCQQMKYGSLVILGADWWQPPANWNPGFSFEEINPYAGEIVMEDEFSSIDLGNWKTSGNVSLALSEYGAGIKLDGNQGTATIESKFLVPLRNGVIFEFRHPPNTQFSCGLFSEKGSSLFIKGSSWTGLYLVHTLDFGIESTMGSYKTYTGAGEDASNRWYAVFLRILNNNQLQAFLTDMSYGKKLSGLNGRFEGNFAAPFRFRCEVSKGLIELNRFSEITFP